MKKVLIGVGIGCGVLVLLGIIGVGVAGYFVKKSVGGVMEASQQGDAQMKELKALNQSYPFKEPAEGEVLTLDEARLNEYFAVRDGALPVFKEFEAKSEELTQKTKNGEKPSISDAMQAGTMVAQFLVKTRASYIEGLKQHKMSPREFHSITGAIFNSQVAGAATASKKAMAEMRKSAQKSLAEVQEKLKDENLSEEERSSLEEQQTAFQSQLDSANEAAGEGLEVSEKSQAAATANLKLLEKYKDRVEKSVNPAFDALIVTDDLKNPFGGLGQQTESE